MQVIEVMGFFRKLSVFAAFVTLAAPACFANDGSPQCISLSELKSAAVKVSQYLSGQRPGRIGDADIEENTKSLSTTKAMGFLSNNLQFGNQAIYLRVNF